MSTRGLVGFVVDGQVKATYNHYDSYPEGLGEDVVSFVKDGWFTREQVENLKLVDESTPPTEEEKAALREYADTGVSTQSLDEWYVLLRNTQGDLAAILESGYMIDSEDFAADSLFCEWGYLINIDTDKVEVYTGFVTDKSALTGRFSDLPVKDYGSLGNKYLPITLIAELDFNDLDNFSSRIDEIAAEQES